MLLTSIYNDIEELIVIIIDLLLKKKNIILYIKINFFFISIAIISF
jgi:hypothetical protein